MSKTLVNIITEDNPIPAYLFIKEKYEEGDRMMYISSKDTEDDLDALSELFNVPATNIDEIILKNDVDELSYEKICRAILARLDHETNDVEGEPSLITDVEMRSAENDYITQCEPSSILFLNG